MNIAEAFKKFKKIRIHGFSKELFCEIKHNLIYLSDGDLYDICPSEYIISEEWEEYKEPVKYLNHKETMQALLEGKKISTRQDGHGYYFYLDSMGNIFNQDHKIHRMQLTEDTAKNYYKLYSK